MTTQTGAILFSALILVAIFIHLKSVPRNRYTEREPDRSQRILDSPSANKSKTKTESTTSTTMIKLRLVIVSDTHGIYNRPIPDGDVLIHCGDSEWSASEFEEWASSHRHGHKIVICGNMDSSLSRDNSFRVNNVSYLQDSSVVVSNMKFYGSPWTPEFVGVFQLSSQKQATDIWKEVPSDTDVLITHGPPKSILDTTSRGRSVGDKMLLDILAKKRVRPRVHCFGHVHESYGTMTQNGTLFCNAAVYNGHRPIVVDLPLDRTLPAVLVEPE